MKNFKETASLNRKKEKLFNKTLNNNSVIGQCLKIDSTCYRVLLFSFFF